MKAKTELLQRDQYAIWKAVERASELIWSRLTGHPGVIELRLEAGPTEEWDDILEIRSGPDGIKRHRWQIKRQSTNFNPNVLEGLLRSLRLATDLDLAHLAIRDQVDVGSIGPLRVLRDICVRAQQPDADLAAMLSQPGVTEFKWIDYVRKCLGLRDEGSARLQGLQFLRGLTISFLGSTDDIRNVAVARLGTLYQDPDTLCRLIHSWIADHPDEIVPITFDLLYRQITHKFQLHPVLTGITTEQDEVISYLNAIKEYCANLPYLALHDIRPSKFLPEIYVDLQTKEPGKEHSSKDKETPSSVHSERLSVAQMMRRSEFCPIVILGGAGAGKSTLLRHLAERAWHAPESIGLSRPHLPLLVQLPNLASRTGFIADRLHDALSQDLPIAQALPQTFFSAWPKRTGAPWLLLLDALDEVPSRNRAQFIQWLTGVLRQFTSVRIVLTTRPHGYQHSEFDINGAKHFEILPFEASQIAAFSERWFGARVSEFEIEYRRIGMGGMESTPLLITIAAKVFLERNALPLRRSGLYSAFVDIVLSESLTRGLGAELGEDICKIARNILSQLALEMSETSSRLNRSRLISKVAGCISVTLRRSMQESAIDAERFLRVMSRRSGLLITQSDSLTFVHPTLQEYFTAAAIVRECNANGKRLWRTYLNNWWRQGWREVVLFTFGILSDQGCDTTYLAERIHPEVLTEWEVAPEFPYEDVWRCNDALCFLASALADGAVIDSREKSAIICSLFGLLGVLARCHVYDFFESGGPDLFDSLETIRGDFQVQTGVRELSRNPNIEMYPRFRALAALLKLGEAESDISLLTDWAVGTGLSPNTSEDQAARIREDSLDLLAALGRQAEIERVLRSAIGSDDSVDAKIWETYMALLKTNWAGAQPSELLVLSSMEFPEALLPDIKELTLSRPAALLAPILTEIMRSEFTREWIRCEIAELLVAIGEIGAAEIGLEEMIQDVDAWDSNPLQDSYLREFARNLLLRVHELKAASP
ncbi:NACHT domain-containing protein [Myxococcus stipitatus]|uniref:NACHT domain-containing protein n=1 Tax=Myxococcus stipitatus TaxID=83455 RepID=UPI0030D61D2A